MRRSNSWPGFMALPLVVVASGALADCTQYPFNQGLKVELVEGGTKIIATASTSVPLDDIESINMARDEATMMAKALIAEFMSEGIFKDEQIDRLVTSSVKASDEGRSAEQETLRKNLTSLRSTSQAMLRGVVPLGECYSPAREMRVSVGLKPETLQAAGALAGSISNSLAREPTAGSAGDGSAAGGTTSLRSSPGYSRDEDLRNF